MERGTGVQSLPGRTLRGLQRGEAVALTVMLLILASLAGAPRFPTG